MSGLNYYECPRGLSVQAGTEIRGGEEVRGCLGAVAIKDFLRGCFNCEHYLHKGLEERLLEEIRREKIAARRAK